MDIKAFTKWTLAAAAVLAIQFVTAGPRVGLDETPASDHCRIDANDIAEPRT